MSSSNNINTTTFVPIAVYIPIAIPVSSTLTASEVQTLMNNSLSSMNSTTFNFHLTQQENSKKTINEQTFAPLSPSLSHSISQINEQNFSLIENMKKHLKEEIPSSSPFSSSPLVEETNPISINKVEPIVETTAEVSDDCLYPSTETSPSYQTTSSEWLSSSDLNDQMRERPIIQSTLDDSLAESKTSSDLAQSLVCSNSAFSASVLRDMSKNSVFFNQSLVQHCQTTSNLPLFSSTLFTDTTTTATSTTTTTQTQTHYSTQTGCNRWCLNWDNPQCNQINQQQCCVFSNESNEVFFPVSPRSCPPSPSSPMPMPSSSSPSSMRFSSSSLLLLTLCSILLRNLFATSALLSLRITFDLQALHYCLFKSNFKSGFSFSDQKFSESGEERREEREEREEEGKGGKGGKGGIIIIDDAADDDAAYDAAYYYYADHHVVHDVVVHDVVVSSLVAPVASLAIRAIA